MKPKQDNATQPDQEAKSSGRQGTAYPPWDEDPRYGDFLYRFLLGSVLVAIVGGVPIALWVGDWSAYLEFWRILEIAFTALCIYAAMVWVVGQVVKCCWRQLRPRRHFQNPEAGSRH